MFRSKKGFTLIEVIVCITIIGILAMIIVPVSVTFFSGTSSTENVQIITQEEEMEQLIDTDARPLFEGPEESDDKGTNKQL